MTNKSEGNSREEKHNRWLSHIRDWQSSGMTQANYCKAHSLALKSFYYWKKKSRNISSPTSLVPVNFKINTMRLTNPISLNIGSRYRIEIQKGFDTETLEQVLTVLNRF